MGEDLVNIDKKIKNLEKELDNLNNLRSRMVAENFKKKYGEKKHSEFYCHKCKKNFECIEVLKSHKSSVHPSNRYEIVCANTCWDTYNRSNYYIDPYY